MMKSKRMPNGWAVEVSGSPADRLESMKEACDPDIRKDIEELVSRNRDLEANIDYYREQLHAKRMAYETEFRRAEDLIHQMIERETEAHDYSRHLLAILGGFVFGLVLASIAYIIIASKVW